MWGTGTESFKCVTPVAHGDSIGYAAAMMMHSLPFAVFVVLVPSTVWAGDSDDSVSTGAYVATGLSLTIKL